MRHGAMLRSEDNKNKKKVYTQLDEEQHARLLAIAKGHGASMSWVVNRVIVDFLEKHGSGQGELFRL